MTPTTIYGRAGGGRSDTSATYNQWGALRTAHHIEAFDLDLPPGGLPVDLAHDGQAIGEAVYLELDPDGQLHAVAVLDDDAITRVDGDIYFSTEAIIVGPDVRSARAATVTRASLVSLGLCFEPATHGLTPIRTMPGDVRSRLDRGSWPVSWGWAHPLLERAVDHLGDRHDVEHRHATRILDRRAHADHAPGLRLRRDPAAMWHTAGGRILTVR
jgi:hypothetical protein